MDKAIKSSNLRMLEFAANKLGDLCQEVVFLGGCTTALLIDDESSPDVRFTIDVDCIVDVISRNAYSKFEKALRKQGFKNAIHEEVMCRWTFDDLVLDVMPIDEKILGFSNYCYKSAIKHPFIYEFPNSLNIKVVSAPYFLATKIEAFKARGKLDYLASHDFEDIISVIDGRLGIVKEVQHSNLELRQYLSKEFQNFTSSRAFHDALPGHFNQYGQLVEDKIDWLLDKISLMIKG